MVSRFKFTKRILFFVVLLCCAVGSQTSFASHLAAGDLWVDYIGNGPGDLKYKITLDIYKACEPNNSSLFNPETIRVSSQSYGGIYAGTGQAITMDTTGSMVGSDTADQLCPTFKSLNACRMPGSPWPGFIHFRYTAIYTLPAPATDWVFEWNEGARNGGILNLCGNAGVYNIIVRCGINNQFRYNNSSPRFTVSPIPYICVNRPATFYNGAVDPNGDSVQVINQQPMGGGTNAGCPPTGPNLEIPYANPYTVANPIATSTPYVVNSVSGATNFTPTLVGKWVLAFRANEYDPQSRTQLGYVTRDVQISVLNCASTTPAIDSTPSNVTNIKANGNVLIGCPGSTFSFKVNASSTANLSLDADNSTTAPGSTFNVSGQSTPNPSGTFTWTPTVNQIGDHVINITATDSSCTAANPIVTVSHLVLLVKIVTGIDAGPDMFGYCANNGKPIQLQVNAGPGVTSLNFKWTSLNGGPAIGLDKDNIYNPKAIVSQTTSYVVSTNDLASTCKRKDTVTINADLSNSVTITPATPVIVCRPGYLQLSATASGPKPLQNLTCGILDTVNCVTQDSVDIIPAGSVPANTNNNTASTPFYGSYQTVRHQYLLKASDLKASGLHSGTLRSLSFKLNGFPSTSINNFKISLKCTGLENINQTTGIISGTTLVYTATGLVTLPAAGGYVKFDFDAPYNWDTTQNLIVDICYANGATFSTAYTYYCNTQYQSSLYIYSSSGNLCGSTTGTGTSATNQIPLMRFNYCPAPEAPFTFTWTSGTYLSDSGIYNPIAYIPKSTKYVVSTAGKNGCIVRDSVSIYVPVHDMTVTPKDTAICYGESVVLSARGGFTYKWYEESNFGKATSLSCDNCANPVASPKQDVTYYVVIGDSVNCNDTITAHVTVKPLPVVNIVNSDTIIKYGQSVQLVGKGASLYYWTPVSSLTDPNIASPVATPTEPTIYTLIGMAANGCRSSDSVKISIDYRDHLLIPTAFSPNGDNLNDEFRIVNLTFQKVVEFRVFNRWGQEIFSTTDSHRGWDGTWKGVAQEMGTYNYVIRLAYPDGYTETYKGDVTIVR